MFIKDIAIKNYRCYRDTRLVFGTTRDKNIVLITGETSSGKTSLFNAIGWCLYGKETQLLLGTKKSIEKPIPNEVSYQEDETAEVSVRITIKRPEAPESETVVVNRWARFRKSQKEPVSENLEISIQDKSGNSQVSLGADPQKVLDSILVPKELASFYLFDGEFLKQIQQFETEFNAGFDKFFRIDAFRQALTTLSYISQEYLQEATKLTRASSKLQASYMQLASLNNDVKERGDQISELDKELLGLIREREESLAEVDRLKDLIELKSKYDNFNSKKTEKNKEREELSKQMDALVLESAYVINSEALRKDALLKIEDVPEVKENKIPLEVREIYLKGLIADKICVCGRGLKPGSEEVKKVEDAIKATAQKGEKEFLLDLRRNITETSSDAMNLQAKLMEYETKIFSLLKANENLDKEIDAILSKNKDIDKEQISTPVDKIRWLDLEIQEKQRNRNDLAQRLAAASQNFTKLQDEIKIAEDENGNKTDLLDKITVTNQIRSIIENFVKKAIDVFSKRIVDEMNKLLKYNEKMNRFSVERSISDSGEVAFNFKESGAQEAYFSGGQTQLKGMIQIAAFVRIMAEMSKGNFRLPVPFVVMDHPVSDVDKERVKQIAEELGKLFGDAQVILFVANDKFDVFSTLSKEKISNKLLIKKENKAEEEARINQV